MKCLVLLNKVVCLLLCTLILDECFRVTYRTLCPARDACSPLSELCHGQEVGRQVQAHNGCVGKLLCQPTLALKHVRHKSGHSSKRARCVLLPTQQASLRVCSSVHLQLDMMQLISDFLTMTLASAC